MWAAERREPRGGPATGRGGGREKGKGAVGAKEGGCGPALSPKGALAADVGRAARGVSTSGAEGGSPECPPGRAGWTRANCRRRRLVSRRAGTAGARPAAREGPPESAVA